MPRADHLTTPELAAVAHGERLPRRAAAEAHLAQCDACRAAVEELRRDDAAAAQLLRLVDHAPPPDALSRVLATAHRRSPRDASRRLGRIAAAALLTGAVAAAALPHSPLRRLFERPSPPATPHGPVAQSPAPTTNAPPRDSAHAGAGIALVPGPQLEVHFLHAGTGRVLVRLSDDSQLALRPQNADVAFAVRADRVVVNDTTGRASFDLIVPRSLGHLRVRIDTAVVFEKRAADIVTRAQSSDHGASYSIDLAVPRPPR